MEIWIAIRGHHKQMKIDENHEQYTIVYKQKESNEQPKQMRRCDRYIEKIFCVCAELRRILNIPNVTRTQRSFYRTSTATYTYTHTNAGELFLNVNE